MGFHNKIKETLLECEPTAADLISNAHRYETELGCISLLYPCYATSNKYEIYCISGDLFEDTEKYDFLWEVQKRIISLLGENYFKYGRL